MSDRPQLQQITDRTPLIRCCECGGWGDIILSKREAHMAGDCEECYGTGLDTIPWCEIMKYRGNEHEDYE